MIKRREFMGVSAAACAMASMPYVFAKENFPMKDFIAEIDEIVSIDSKSGHEPGVNKVISIMASKFKNAGWTVTEHNCPGRGNVLLASNTPDQGEFDVLLSAHADTVQPVGNAAKYPMKVEGDIAHGAGVADDKSSLIAMWWICRDLPEETKRKLKIGVVVNPGEESGNDAVREYMNEVGKRAKTALVYEPGRPGNGYVNVRKGAIFLSVIFRGVTAHAGNEPEKGRNAIEAMALAIPRIKEIAKDYEGVTLNADVVKGGTVPNAIADYAEVQFDFRFTDNASRDKVIAEIRKLCDKGFLDGVTTELVYKQGSALALTEKSKELAKVVDQAAAELGQEKPKWMAVGGASDGNKFSGAGAAVVCAMGVVGGNLHNPEKEWSDLSTAPNRIALGKKVLEIMARNK